MRWYCDDGFIVFFVIWIEEFDLKGLWFVWIVGFDGFFDYFEGVIGLM